MQEAHVLLMRNLKLWTTETTGRGPGMMQTLSTRLPESQGGGGLEGWEHSQPRSDTGAQLGSDTGGGGTAARGRGATFLVLSAALTGMKQPAPAPVVLRGAAARRDRSLGGLRARGSRRPCFTTFIRFPYPNSLLLLPSFSLSRFASVVFLHLYEG